MSAFSVAEKYRVYINYYTYISLIM